MEINITSTETIKPSLPTPNDRKNHKICLFDVFQLDTYFPLILFYRKTNNKNSMQGFSQVSAQLKKSLSEALTICYPLAGRRSDPFSINCNDEGAIYMEANVNINMEEFLKPPKLELLNRLLPCETNKTHPHHEVLPQLVIQVNNFKCGGIAIALCTLHTLLDACSCSAFLRTWSSICKGSSREEITCPDFSSGPSLFPPRNTFGMRAGVLNIDKDSNIEAMCTTTRFLFDASAINELRAKLANYDGGVLTEPTRYQAVSSITCKHMILAACTLPRTHKVGASYIGSPFIGTKPVVVLHVVDMRRRMGEPFSQDSVGNLLWPAVMIFENVNKDTEIGELVRISRQEIGKLTKDLFLRVQNDPDFTRSDECGELMLEGVEIKDPISFVFTSWANMGFSELDFGLGKPLWLAQRGGTKETIPNTAVFVETNDGIEAWVTMREKHIAILENDVDFLKFALPNPSISNT